MERYQDLALEVKRIHRTTKKTVIAIVIDALGTISKNARPGWEDQSAWHFSAQLSAILGTAHIAEGGCVSKLREAAETYGIFKLFKPP